MALQDGRFLTAPERYDALSPDLRDEAALFGVLAGARIMNRERVCMSEVRAFLRRASLPTKGEPLYQERACFSSSGVSTQT